MLKPKQYKAIAALINEPTREKAAKAAGISHSTIEHYCRDPEFQAEYKRACRDLIAESTRRAQIFLAESITALHGIMIDENENGGVRVSAARSILEYGLRLTEFNDIYQDFYN